jgi:hypothetical protein
MAVLLVAAATLFGTALGAGAVITIGSITSCCQPEQSSYEQYVASLPRASTPRVSTEAKSPETVLNIAPVTGVVDATTTEPATQVSGLSTVKGWYKDFVDTDGATGVKEDHGGDTEDQITGSSAGSPPNIVINELATDAEKEFSNLIKALNQPRVLPGATVTTPAGTAPTKTKKDN